MQDNPYVIDIESNGLLADMLDFSSFPYKLKPEARQWCVVIRNLRTNEAVSCVMQDITPEWVKDALKDCTHLIAHNGIKFDFIVMKLFGVFDYRVGYPGQDDLLFGQKIVFIDSLILSRLFNPDRYGGHSLESWGERVKNLKIGFREQCVAAGLIDDKAPKGAEFLQYSDLMLEYCIGDTSTNADTFMALMKELGDYPGWIKAIKMENKLADLAVKRESFGFWFDKKYALTLLDDLAEKMQALMEKVNPLLPPKPMGKTELKTFTPPANQFLKNGKPNANIVKFADRTGGLVEQMMDGDEVVGYFLKYELEGEELKRFPLPHNLPIKTHVPADIGNLDHVKMHLMSLGWIPTEWAERDLTKDAKKQNLPYEKRIAALERWANDTFDGKYKEARLETVGYKSKELLIEKLSHRLEEDRPVRVPTAPKVRVGIEKELCPNLTSLGEKVDFANDFALFLTYRHRRSCIAGGDLEDVDYEAEYPNTGYLSMYRDVDGRVATPAIEIGAATHRYRHIGIANVPRASSVYGKEMRSLFGAGSDGVQFGYDFSSLEARVMANYVKKYTDGEELATAMLAEKPNDVHSVNARKMGISRSDAKSLTYAILYGAQPNKIAKMLSISVEDAKGIFDAFWDAVPALKELKENVEKYWEKNGNTFIPGIDGRKILIRSKHSILNSLFQSTGVICAKYVNVYSMQILEEQGLCIDPFVAKPDVCEMIAYHDECQLFVNPSLFSFKKFETEEEAKQFVLDWEGEQLSAITEGTTWYVALPNQVSKAIDTAIRKTEKDLRLSVELGFEFAIARNWYGCH